MWNWIYALIPFALFAFLAVLFTRKRFSAKITYFVWAVVITAISVTHIVLFSIEKENTLLLSLLPFTAYLPIIAVFFALSKRNVVSNLLAMLVALLCSVSVVLLNDIASKIWANNANTTHFGSSGYLAVNLISLLGASAVLGFVCFRYLRKVFAQEKVLSNKTWYALPAVFLLLLFSLYQMEILRQPLLIAFLLVMNVSVLTVITAFIVTKYKNIQTEAERSFVEQQLAAEREQYDALKVAVEADKRYRHDVKHHFAAIAALAAEGKDSEITEYVETLGASLTESEMYSFCKNNVINAVLNTFCNRAKQANVETETEAEIPEELPMEECDLCALLSNAFDNALNACREITEGEKKITLSLKCDGTKTAIRIVNTTAIDVPLGKDGFPIYERTEQHGWGLSSMQCVAKKYGGFVSCASEAKTFTLSAVLFNQSVPPPKKRKSKKKATLYSVAAVPLILLTAILSINCMPSTARALEQVPVIGKVVEIIDFRSWGWQWGDSGIEINQPITNDKDANERIEGFVKECRERFEWYYARKYHGYVYSEFNYKEIVNDDAMFVLQMSCLIQAGSSAEYMRYFVMDKTTGEIVKIEDLFADGSNWNEIVSLEIRRQMQEAVENDLGYYYGFGDWSDRVGFTRLDDPNFYIDAHNNLVIVFDEQEVAPGNMGSPDFTVSYSTVKEILSKNSLIKECAEC